MTHQHVTILMYTFGTGSGHLMRVNAVLKGFLRTGVDVQFYVVAPRSKYLSYLHPGATLVTAKSLPAHVDIFICDWKADTFVDSIPTEFASLWVGLRRMGRIASRFPRHFLVVAIEPLVGGDMTLWPIISTWRDELVSEEEFRAITGTGPDERVALLCENGSYASHPKAILQAYPRIEGMTSLKCSNSPFSEAYRDIDFAPIARLFARADCIVVGAGYNSIHECLCFSHPLRFTPILVGGDDQRRRLRHYLQWVDLCPGDSQAHVLARHLLDAVPS